MKRLVKVHACTIEAIFQTLAILFAAVYTDIFVVQSLHKRWFKVYTSLYKKVHVYSSVVLYSRWIALCVQNMAVTGHVQQVVAQQETFLYKVIHAGNIGPKDQVVFDHRDCK